MTFGEVEGEGGLVCPEVVDVEDEFFWKVFFGPPDHPAHSSVDQAVLVSTDVDALHPGQSEVPLQLWVEEGRHKAPTRCIHMDWDIPPSPQRG